MVKIIMKDNTIKNLDGYSDIPSYIGHELVFYKEYGSYQGDWIMVSKKNNTIYLWRGGYGSCSGCDHYQGAFDYDEDNAIQEKGDAFCYAYSPEEEYDIEDINKDIFYNYIKKQQLSEEYIDLSDDKCMKIAEDIVLHINKI